MRSPSYGLLALALAGLFLAACPRGQRSRVPSAGQDVPSVLWSMQLEGEAWPYGLMDDLLLVLSMRTAEEGFSFPIQLNALAPADGKSLWSTPTRPWLLNRNVPWSFAMDRMDPVLGVWEKGDVLRTLRLEDGQDAWSLPECRGLVVMKPGLVTAARRALWLLDPKDGRTLKRHRLPSTPLLFPLRTGDLVVLTLGEGRLIAVEPVTGQIRWERTLSGVPPAEIALLLSWDGGVLVALSEAEGSESGGRLLALQGASGAPMWEARLPTQGDKASASSLARLRIAGDLLLWPESQGGCVRALDLASGKARFRTCGLEQSSPPVRFGDSLYALGQDESSARALRRGDPWYAVDFPLVVISAVTGQVSPFLQDDLHGPSRALRNGPGKQAKRSIRATRLPFAPVTDGVIYLLGRNRFLSALRVGYPPAPDPGS